LTKKLTERQKKANAKKRAAAKRAQAGAKKTKPKQRNLPTVTAEEKKLQRAILYYKEKRDVRIGCTEDEVAAKAALTAAMTESGHCAGDSYSFTDGNQTHTCTLTPTDIKPKVTSKDVAD
jgi:hypothetical protein